MVIIVFCISAFLSILTISCQQIPSAHTSLGTRAAIIDQLYTNYPNDEFTTKVTQILEDFGYGVDLYHGDDITVSLYRNLPAYGYKLIIFRSHSGALTPNSQDLGAIMGTYLFTNESFNAAKYTKERLGKELAPARIDTDAPSYFAIGPKFIVNSMEGRFNHTVIVVDGCSCIYKYDLAQAFTSKGASCYIAWDAMINLNYGDETMITLVDNLCSKRFTVSKAVYSTMAAEGPDQYYAVLKYYPPESADKTLEQLVQ